jgi:iron complex outermembrane receptor protein
MQRFFFRPPGSGGAMPPRLRCALATLACCLICLPARAEDPPAYLFRIDARQLSQALIQFSHQSGLAIVFPDRLTDPLPGTALRGSFTVDAALTRLLADSGLGWELVDGRIIAIVERRCQTDSPDADCASGEQTLQKYPLYTPGLEETYVFGRRITGSRIRRAGYAGSAPVDLISAPDIELSGAQTIGELLKFVPAVAGNSLSTAISNGGDGTATVTLRGLPASNTLVLINGRRIANDGLAGESVDLNSIPPAAVERIEILKDGASAIYGSDAIAGVVNIIMKRDFHGFLAEGLYGQAEAGDLETRTATLQYGTGLRDASFFLSATSYEQDPIFSRDRTVSRSADTRPLGGADLRSSATPAARVTLPDGTLLIADGTGYRPATAEDLFDYQAFTTAVVPLTRRSVHSSVSYDLSELLSIQVDASHIETRAEATLAPTPVFTAFEQLPLPIAADNRYNSFGQTLDDVRRRLVELPPRQQRNRSDVDRFSASLAGLSGNWDWQLGYNWSRSKAAEITTHMINGDNLQRGLGPAADCRGVATDGCVAVDLLGEPGSITPEQLDYISITGEVSGYSKLSAVTFDATHSLLPMPHGEGALALGIEHRQEATSKQPGARIAEVVTIGGSNFEPTRGDRDVTELYAETHLPLWRSADGRRGFDLEAAVRYSNYSDFGDTTNPKLGGRLRLSPAVMLRSTYARGFRAPSLNELYQGVQESQAFISDPCTQPANVGVLPGCTQLADATRNQFLTLTGGNSTLSPETATSFSAGLVWTPEKAPGLVASLDYFAIDQRNVVNASAQYVVNRNARYGEFAGQVERDPLGNLTLVTATNLNAGDRDVRGIDLALNYQLPGRTWGQLSFSSSATYLDRYRAQLDASAPIVDFAGTFVDDASEGLGGIPQWKGQVGVQWARQRWRGSYELNYVSGMREQIPGTDRRRTIESWAAHDLQLSYMFDVASGLRWSVGVDNLLDADAPFAASAFNDNIDGRTHELKGRLWYTRLSQRL